MIIALQTADSMTRVWLGEEPTFDLTPRLEWESGRTLSEHLIGRLQEVLRSSDESLDDLTGIIIYSGPGSFTSLRIGHTVANALADSLHIPITGSQGDRWIQVGLERLKHTDIGQIALPYYGSEANITRPKA